MEPLLTDHDRRLFDVVIANTRDPELQKEMYALLARVERNQRRLITRDRLITILERVISGIIAGLVLLIMSAILNRKLP